MALATYVTTDDWVGLYADDELAVEGHSINAYEALRPFINAQIEDVVMFEIDYTWMWDRGKFPQHLSDIPQEVRR
jgi:hypothetical protein